MNHGPAVELGVDHASKKKSVLGVWLFIAYTIIYSIFVAIIVSNYKTMGIVVLGEQTLAVVYGFGLITLAIIMGIVYNYFCTKLENKYNKEEQS